MYNGSWWQNNKHGQGTMTYANGDVYVGAWQKDVEHGQGTYTYAAPFAQYVGEWRNGQRNGRGVVTYADGTVYSGEWMHNLQHGAGELKFPDGRVQTGVWNRGRLNPDPPPPPPPHPPRPPHERRPGGPLIRPPRPSGPFEYWTVRGKPRHGGRESWEERFKRRRQS